jgi:hypothetical protein
MIFVHGETHDLKLHFVTIGKPLDDGPFRRWTAADP